jgi:hypothetical protein
MNRRPTVLTALSLAALHCGSNGAQSSNDGGALHDAVARDSPKPGDAGGGDHHTRDAGAPRDVEAHDTGHPAEAGHIDGGAVTGTTVAFFMGVNGLITDTVANLAPIGNVREYHNWGWLGNNYNDQPYPQTLYTPDLTSFGWDWDTFFSGLKAAGASGFPAVQGAAPWVNNSALPPANGSPTAAASYIAHGDTMFQIAARWGSAVVPTSELKLYAGQTTLTGAGTVEYYEDFNEQDNISGFTGDVYAAMASADYDGDQKRLGATIGIKNADPNAKLVMGGLSGAYSGSETWVASITKFLDAARTWATANRGGSFPADVLNVHYYSFGPGAPAPALSPEADGVEAKLAAVVAYRDANLPGMPVWWTEFGYDTFAGSPLHAPALGGNSAFIVQGQWLVRDLLAGLAAGIERATLFELDDTCTPPASACNTQFATCGLLPMPDSSPKASWYFLATFRARLGSMVYSAPLMSGVSNVMIYQFKETMSMGGALVVWAPTSNATVVSGYSLSIPAGFTSASAVALTDQQQNGVETSLSVSSGHVTLDVSETPTIVLYSP